MIKLYGLKAFGKYAEFLYQALERELWRLPSWGLVCANGQALVEAEKQYCDSFWEGDMWRPVEICKVAGRVWKMRALDDGVVIMFRYNRKGVVKELEVYDPGGHLDPLSGVLGELYQINPAAFWATQVALDEKIELGGDFSIAYPVNWVTMSDYRGLVRMDHEYQEWYKVRRNGQVWILVWVDPTLDELGIYPEEDFEEESWGGPDSEDDYAENLRQYEIEDGEDWCGWKD